MPTASAEPRRAPDVQTSHTGHLPLGGFQLTIEGFWRGSRSSEPQKNLRLDFSGKWQLSSEPQLLRSTRIEGNVQVEGVADAAPMKGTLSVRLDPLWFDLAVEFTDSRGERCSITANTRTVFFNASARSRSVKGILMRGRAEIGKVDCKVDRSLLKKALPSRG